MLTNSLSQLKTVRVCGPRYWPQEVELFPEGMTALLCVISLLIGVSNFICGTWPGP